MFDRIYTQHYINLLPDTRDGIRKAFDIQRTGITEIRDLDLISDGTTNSDLSVITLDKLEQYTGLKGTFAELWHKALEKIEGKEILPEVKEEQIDEESIKTKKFK